MRNTQHIVRNGQYRHFKGKDYLVLDLAKHSETDELMVVYRCLYGDYVLSVRPLSLFSETVEVNGEPVERFEFVKALSHEDVAELSSKFTHWSA
ncbi:DUF1653 domain-containing protein [Marinibactrum halimedae]|uniref:DUF1653 domain-containing protein n=1 Tax=Marinibactrum halimedae TaxID=1444977 RepID=UPI001E5F9A39|nr:DUF1653 domain-containing protein [Marinibactrum halimedae]MCD9459373.1 DUF1653 domain-containing protein [Marinibactrum halimedae]